MKDTVHILFYIILNLYEYICINSLTESTPLLKFSFLQGYTAAELTAGGGEVKYYSLKA